jgi:hypothetical protein
VTATLVSSALSVRGAMMKVMPPTGLHYGRLAASMRGCYGSDTVTLSGSTATER